MKESNLDYFRQLKEKKETPKSVSNKVWSYTRVSTKDQSINFSLQTQKDSIILYAEENDLIVTRQFGETYESASSD